jgi:hypothetical protein
LILFSDSSVVLSVPVEVLVFSDYNCSVLLVSSEFFTIHPVINSINDEVVMNQPLCATTTILILCSLRIVPVFPFSHEFIYMRFFVT